MTFTIHLHRYITVILCVRNKPNATVLGAHSTLGSNAVKHIEVHSRDTSGTKYAWVMGFAQRSPSTVRNSKPKYPLRKVLRTFKWWTVHIGHWDTTNLSIPLLPTYTWAKSVVQIGSQKYKSKHCPTPGTSPYLKCATQHVLQHRTEDVQCLYAEVLRLLLLIIVGPHIPERVNENLQKPQQHRKTRIVPNRSTHPLTMRGSSVCGCRLQS